MARPSGWDILGLDGDPTPGVVESVQALAKQFGDFAHDVEAAYRSLNSFGSDANALQWVGQTADAFKGQFGPLPGRLQKLYTSYSEASDALSAYAPALQAAQNKADAALRQAQDAHADLQHAATNANNAAADLKTAQQNHAANPNPQAVTDAQTAHDTAQTNLNNAKARMADLTRQANDAYNDRINAAKTCATALHHAQSDGIHNKHWWEHVGEFLSEWGGKIAEIANDLAPFLDVLALATSWIPGVDVVTAALAEADNLIALAGTGLEIVGDGMQGHWGDALMGAGMLGLQFVGGKAIEKVGGKLMDKYGGKFMEKIGSRGNESAICKTDPVDVVSGQMLIAETDLELPGILPLILRRSYGSDYEMGRLFGPGWSSTLDQRLSVNSAGVHFVGDDGQRLDYPTPNGLLDVLPAYGARWPLVWDRNADEIRITDPQTGQTRHFSVVHFQDSDGHIRDLTAITDRNGNRIDISRDPYGAPVSVEAPGYRVVIETTTFAHGTRVSEIRVDDGTARGIPVREFRYDAVGRLTAVVNSSGLPLQYEYNNAHLITGWRDRTGYRYSYEYDEWGRVVRTSGDDGYMAGSFVYGEQTGTTEFTDSLGNRTTFGYDENGHLTIVTDALGGTVLTEYDLYGRLLHRTDELGQQTNWERDSAGDPIRITQPDGGVVEAEYNEFHQIVSLRTQDGAEWQQEYDERGNLAKVIDPLGAMTDHTHDVRGALVSSTDALGNTTRYQTDAAGLAIAIVDPLGARTVAVRDAMGRIVETTDATGAVTGNTWSVEGLLTGQRLPNGAHHRWEYDLEGDLVSYTDPVGALTSFEPGPFSQARARVDNNGDRYEFVFDTELRLTAVTNPAGAVWAYERDPLGRVVAETDFVGRTLRYSYDAAGQLIERRDGFDRGSTYEYDRGGRLARRSTPSGQYTYSYDPVGRITGATGPDGSTVNVAHDLAGRIVSESIDGRRTEFSYDGAGRRIRRLSPAGLASRWSFDAAGRPTGLSSSTGGISLEFDVLGQETKRSFGPDVWLTAEFDSVGHTIANRLSANGQVMLERGYEWRIDDSPVAVTDNLRGVRGYTLDDVGRVVRVAAETWSETYRFDAYGNLAYADRPGDTGAVGARTIDGTLVRQAGRTTFDHDGAGRVIRKTRRTLDGRRLQWEYIWDSDDRLVETRLPDGTTWRYRYDPFGRRVAKTCLESDGSLGAGTQFAWDGVHLIEESTIHGDGTRSTLTWDYDPGTFRPAGQTRTVWADDSSQEPIDQVFYAIVTDIVGTPTELVTSDGRIAWHTTTTLWGGEIATTGDDGTDCPLRFPGQYHDRETGLHYNLQRYYNPDIAAYLTPDPLGLEPAPNDHAYVLNPLVWMDPLGLKGCNLPGTKFDVPDGPGVYTIHMNDGTKYVGSSTDSMRVRVNKSARSKHAVYKAGYRPNDVVNVTWMSVDGLTKTAGRRLEQTVMEGMKAQGVTLLNRRDPEIVVPFGGYF